MSEVNIEQKTLPSSSELYDQGKINLADLRELKVGAGSSIFYTDKEGSRWGHTTFDSANAWIKVDGSCKFKASDGTVLMDSANVSGDFLNVINTRLNTASKTILSDFIFTEDDYAGAFKAGNPTWDERTGLITGGSGVLINARGILGANDGTATFTLDATTGDATFAGTLSAPNGTLGTITAGTIVGGTIKNAEGDIVIDSTGLNSTANFIQSGVTYSSSQHTTSTTWVNVTGSTLTSFTLSRPTLAVIEIQYEGYNSRYLESNGEDSNYGFIKIVSDVDGDLYYGSIIGENVLLIDEGAPSAVLTYDDYKINSRTILLSAGTHTLKLQYENGPSGDHATYLVNYFFGYTLLGI